MRMINNDAYNEAAAREAQARADMMELEAAKRRNEAFVRQSRPGSYLTTDAAEAENKRLAAEGWRRGDSGTLSRDAGMGTESVSYGLDGKARFSYYPSERKEQPTNWNEALRQQRQRQASVEGGDKMAESMYDQMREVEGRVVMAREERYNILNDGLVAAMRFAADTENSGRLPRSACELLTRQFGMDGVKSGVFDAGYVPNDMTVDINGQPTKVKKGSFGITLAGRDQNGNVTYNPMFLSPTDVYAVMNANRSQFSDEQIAARRDALLQSGYSEKELAGLVDMNFSMNHARGRAEQMRRTAEQNEFNRWLQLQKNAAARGAERSAGSEAKYDDKYAERLKGDWQDLVDKYNEEPTPEQQKEIAAAKAKYNRYVDGFSGNESTPAPEQGGQATPEQRAERVRQAQAQLAARASAQKPTQQNDVNPGGGEPWTPGSDLRNDGKTYKGTGWLGVLRLPNGGVASEYTVGVDIDGKEVDIPTLVPTLTKAEQDMMVNDIIPNSKEIPETIMKKAVDFAKMRLANGQSVFANDGKPSASQPTTPPQNAIRRPSGADIQADFAGKGKKSTPPPQKRPESNKGTPPPNYSTNSTQNNAEASSRAQPIPQRKYEDLPMLPQEREAEIKKRLKEYQRVQKELGRDISDDQLQRMIDDEMKEAIGEREWQAYQKQKKAARRK